VAVGHVSVALVTLLAENGPDLLDVKPLPFIEWSLFRSEQRPTQRGQHAPQHQRSGSQKNGFHHVSPGMKDRQFQLLQTHNSPLLRPISDELNGPILTYIWGEWQSILLHLSD
jgi:hypothetical protein